MHVVIHLEAPNDANGNPRRLYMVITTDSSTTRYFDVGYNGRAAYRDAFPDAIEGSSFNISAGEYRALRKLT